LVLLVIIQTAIAAVFLFHVNQLDTKIIEYTSEDELIKKMYTEDGPVAAKLALASVALQVPEFPSASNGCRSFRS
jgi:hypothetical protein